MKTSAKKRILNLLRPYELSNPKRFLEERPLVEPSRLNQHYFYEPTHRTITPAGFTNLKFKNANSTQTLLYPGLQSTLSERRGIANPSNEPPFPVAPYPVTQQNTDTLKNWLQAGLVSGGAVIGLALQPFIKLVRGQISAATPQGVRHFTTYATNATGTAISQGMKSRQNMLVMIGFFALSAIAGAGKLFIDGLRQIEVTRINAKTELEYQNHNWLTQDPAFHEIAETEALEDALQALAQDLVWLVKDPASLHKRIQAILLNIGRNSAPKYFPMTPPVGLVEARF